MSVRFCDRWKQFQPTLPLRGATPDDDVLDAVNPISTHAPPAGSDVCVLPDQSDGAISTHAPPAGSDPQIPGDRAVIHISTHAPPAGSDCKSAQIFLKKQVLLPINSCFYSRSRTAAAKNYSLAGSNLAPVRVRTPTRYCDRFRFAVKE